MYQPAEVWITATFHSVSHPSSVRMMLDVCVCFAMYLSSNQL